MYLIYGESFRLIDDEIKKIIKDNTNIITMDLSVSILDEVLTEATYVSMFQEKKFLIVKNASFFTSSKETDNDLEFFFSYMENPVALTTIIFTTYDKIDLRKKVTKTFQDKYKIISVYGLKVTDIMSKARDFVFANHYKIDNETLEYIVSVCQNNYDLVYNELEKLFLFYNEPQKIKLEDAKEVVSRLYNDNNFKFVEAVISKDMKNANVLLEDLYRIKVDPIALIMLLAREYRLLYCVKLLMERGYPKKSVCKELGLQDWQVEKLARNVTRYYMEDLENYIKELARVDYRVKSGQSDKFLELKTFLLTII